MKGVAYLIAVAENSDRLISQCLQEEVGDPALVFGAELARAVNTAHSHDRAAKPEDPGVVANVLVGRALRAAVGAVEIKGSAFIDAAVIFDIGGHISLAFPPHVALGEQASIDL